MACCTWSAGRALDMVTATGGQKKTATTNAPVLSTPVKMRRSLTYETGRGRPARQGEVSPAFVVSVVLAFVNQMIYCTVMCSSPRDSIPVSYCCADEMPFDLIHVSFSRRNGVSAHFKKTNNTSYDVELRVRQVSSQRFPSSIHGN